MPTPIKKENIQLNKWHYVKNLTTNKNYIIAEISDASPFNRNLQETSYEVETFSSVWGFDATPYLQFM